MFFVLQSKAEINSLQGIASCEGEKVKKVVCVVRVGPILKFAFEW